MSAAGRGHRRRAGHAATALALLLLLQPCTAALSEEAREQAFIGYSESPELDPACVNSNAECAVWAAGGECVHNPVFMRSSCLAACRVFPACVKHMDVWSGHATPDGTARFALGGLGFKPARNHFRKQPGGDALTLSSIGVGTYLGDPTDAEDAAVVNAVIRSVAEGLNVIDSASNYRDGRGEVAVGRALHALRLSSGVERDQLVVSTKAGFVGAPDQFSKLQAAGKISAADVAQAVHCMHPACLASSLEESLRRLSLTTVDLLYIHNPAEMWSESLGPEEFYNRLRAAFRWAEGERAKGRLRAYGVATWSSLRLPPEQRGHLSLQRAVALAREVGGEGHGFRFVQLPVSAGMPEAWARPWQVLEDGRKVTLMEAAQLLGVGVFASGPLMEGGLLADTKLALALGALPQLSGVRGDAARLLQLARSTPGLLAAVVGHKKTPHVEENCQLVGREPLAIEQFEAAMRALGVTKEAHFTA